MAMTVSERRWRLGERRLTLTKHDVATLHFGGESIAVEVLNINNIRWNAKKKINHPDPDVITDKVKQHLRDKCCGDTNVVGYKTIDEIKYSPAGAIILEQAFRKPSTKKNPMLKKMVSRGKLRHKNCITIITFESIMDQYPLDDRTPVEYLYEGGEHDNYYGSATKIVEELGFKNHYLAESVFYITKTGEEITFETTSVEALKLFEELVELIEEDLNGVAEDPTRIALLNASGRAYGTMVDNADLEEYLSADYKAPPTEAMHEAFWNTNEEALSQFCTREEYMSINARSAVVRVNNSQQKFWVLTNVTGAEENVQLTHLGSFIIVGTKTFRDLHMIWLHGVKIYIEAFMVSVNVESDNESEEEDVDDQY